MCSSLKTGRNGRFGFTLIELLVVIAIIAILAAILFPVFASARKKAIQTTCLANIKQLALGVIMYAYDNDGRLPSAWPTVNPDFVQNPLLPTWYPALYPAYVDDNRVFKCPAVADPLGYGMSCWMGNVYLDRISVPTKSIMLAEMDTTTKNSAWVWGQGGGMDPMPDQDNGGYPWDNTEPRHNGGMNVAFAGGNAMFVKEVLGLNAGRANHWGIRVADYGIDWY